MVSSLQNEKKDVNYDDVSSGLDLEFQAEGTALAPEPASYETAYVTSHKHACRSGAFSFDGALVATGSVDASIKILDVDRMGKFEQSLEFFLTLNFGIFSCKICTRRLDSRAGT